MERNRRSKFWKDCPFNKDYSMLCPHAQTRSGADALVSIMLALQSSVLYITCSNCWSPYSCYSATCKCLQTGPCLKFVYRSLNCLIKVRIQAAGRWIEHHNTPQYSFNNLRNGGGVGVGWGWGEGNKNVVKKRVPPPPHHYKDERTEMLCPSARKKLTQFRYGVKGNLKN